MNLYLITYNILLILNVIATDDPYCKNCKKSIFYKTDCNYSKHCEKVEAINLTPYKDNILQFHNEYRRDVAVGLSQKGWPSSSNMVELIYNNSLEEAAKCVVNLCDDFVQFPVIYDTNGKEINCNVVLIKKVGSLIDLIRESVLIWYKTIVNCPKYISSFNATTCKCTEFTQLAWGKTVALGCAGIFYKSKRLQLLPSFLFVCFYDPPGNRNNEEVYMRGFPSSDCPNFKMSINYVGMCDNPVSSHYHSKSANNNNKDYIYVLVIHFIVNKFM